MGVLIFSSHAWIDYLEHHGVCTPDLGAHWPEDGWQGWRKTGPSLGPDTKGQDSVGHQEGKTGTWLGSAHITAHRSACIWWTHLILDFSPDFLQGLLLRFRQGQLGGDRIALGNQGPLLLLCQDQGAWSLQLLCRPRSRKGSKRSSRAHWREASWGTRRVCYDVLQTTKEKGRPSVWVRSGHSEVEAKKWKRCPCECYNPRIII